MTALFFSRPVRPETLNYWTLYGGSPEIAGLRVVFLAFVCFVFIHVVRLSLAFASISRRPSMKIGLRVVATGGVVGQLWVLLEVARALVPALGGPRPPLVTE